MTNEAKHVTDVVAGSLGVAAWLHWMPEVAATLTVIWYVIRFIEYIREKVNGKKPGG